MTEQEFLSSLETAPLPPIKIGGEYDPFKEVTNEI